MPTPSLVECFGPGLSISEENQVLPVVIVVVVIVLALVLLDVFFYRSLVKLRTEVERAAAAGAASEGGDGEGLEAARQAYASAADTYNTKIETVPWSAIARRFKFEPHEA